MDATARAEQRVGDTIAGKYTLDRLLGSGGMGAVYAAVHQFTQRRVAVKLMHANVARSKVAAERFLREAQAPGSIGHPGIVEVLDGGRDDDGSLYLVLELLEGETLAAAIKAEALDVQAVGYVALELLDALAAAHKAGFVHRDIKPENVFLVPDVEAPLVKLLDFGVAGVLAEDNPGLTVAGAVLGTPLYMSPEQAMGRRVDARSDLWSVGAVMYQALSGRPPFGGDSFQALVVSISTREHLPLSALRPDVPVRIAQVVERALHKDVAQRWQSAAEMAEALHRALEHAKRARVVPQDPAAPRVPQAALRASQDGAARAHVDRAGAPRWWPLAAALIVAFGAAAAWMLTRQQAHDTRESLASLQQSAASLQQRDAAPPRASQPTPAQANTETREPAAPAHPAQPASAPAAPAQAVAARPVPAQPVAAQPAAHPSTTPAAALGAVLAAHQGELEGCYREAMVAMMMQPGAADAPAPGPLRIDVELAITAAGDVHDVTLRGAAPGDMQRCATTAMRSWRFPGSDTGTSVSFPVVFQPTVVKP
jgi:serine/threonine-protein kinase